MPQKNRNPGYFEPTVDENYGHKMDEVTAKTLEEITKVGTYGQSLQTTLYR
jgi:hypothetical protein